MKCMYKFNSMTFVTNFGGGANNTQTINVIFALLESESFYAKFQYNVNIKTTNSLLMSLAPF